MPEFIAQQDYITTCLQGGQLASVWVAEINRYGWLSIPVQAGT